MRKVVGLCVLAALALLAAPALFSQQAAITRYDQIGAVGRRHVGTTPREPARYDWQGMWECGRNVYGNPEQCIQGIHHAMQNYQFDVVTTMFNYGGLPHEAVMRAMRLFAREVMPAFQGVQPGGAHV